MENTQNKGSFGSQNLDTAVCITVAAGHGLVSPLETTDVTATATRTESLLSWLLHITDSPAKGLGEHNDWFGLGHWLMSLFQEGTRR